MYERVLGMGTEGQSIAAVQPSPTLCPENEIPVVASRYFNMPLWATSDTNLAEEKIRLDTAYNRLYRGCQESQNPRFIVFTNHRVAVTRELERRRTLASAFPWMVLTTLTGAAFGYVVSYHSGRSRVGWSMVGGAVGASVPLLYPFFFGAFLSLIGAQNI